MSRLFEALSNLEADPSAKPADRPGASSVLVIPTEASAGKSAAPEKAPQSRPVPGPMKAGRLAAALAQTAPQDVIVKEPVATAPAAAPKVIPQPRPKTAPAAGERAVQIRVSPESRLVALTEPNSLGAEKFRALFTRLDDMRKQGALRSFQVTSSMLNEGKTLVAANTAVTLAKYSGSRTLLVEGDLHRPGLATVLGLEGLPGLGEWWSGSEPELGRYVHRLHGLALWLLPVGQFRDRPSDILSSSRFRKAFGQLAKQFDWLVVDSTPMLPIVDVNLWSKLLDGTLLVVREGQTPVHALKKALQALIRPKLLGVVMNEASGSDQGRYREQYSAALNPERGNSS